MKEGESVEVRLQAAKALRKICDPKAIPALKCAMSDSDHDVSQWAAIGLATMHDPQAITTLTQGLVHSDHKVRSAAAIGLANVSDPQALTALTQAPGHEDSNIRECAAIGLGKIGDPRSVPPLVQALRDREGRVSEFAAEALVRIGRQAIPALIQALTDNDNEGREVVAEVLGKISDPRSLPALVGALEKCGEYNWLLHCALAEAIVKTDSQDLQTLSKKLRDEDPDIRAPAAMALGRLGDAQAVYILSQTLKALCAKLPLDRLEPETRCKPGR